MAETMETLLARLCRETGAVYIVTVPDNRIVFLNEKCQALIGVNVIGEKVDRILSRKPQLRKLFSFQREHASEWEFYDIADKRLYKLRQICYHNYIAVSADDITDVLNLNCAVTDYLRLMISLSDMQAELIAHQDGTLVILMKTLLQQFSAHAVYVSLRNRQGTLLLWSLSQPDAEPDCTQVDELPSAIQALPANIIRAADITYEFRIVSPEPPELWQTNHAVVMDMASVYLESATLREQIQWDNGHDKLTGLSNRANYLLAASERYAKLQSVGVVFIDIDNLKQTNDELGHLAGDQLIQKASRVLLTFLSDSVDAYRMGGDEFMLVLCDCTEADLREMDLQLSQRIAEANRLSPLLPLTVSIGIAYAVQPLDLEAVIRVADGHMYEQKRAHKATIRD